MIFFAGFHDDNSGCTWQIADQADSQAGESAFQAPASTRPAASAAVAASSTSAAGAWSVLLTRCRSCARASGTPPFCFASFCKPTIELLVGDLFSTVSNPPFLPQLFWCHAMTAIWGLSLKDSPV